MSPFFTELDGRARIKGSRDPLGIQQVWTRLGRNVIGNLTTVSTSLRDFIVLLLGYYFAEQIADEIGAGSELDTFLKWEQLAAYARAEINKEPGFRGTERVHKRLSESRRITLSAETSHQILSNQKIYGLWGLYTVPARASALLEGDPPRLTLPARALVERIYMPALADAAGKGARRIVELLRSPQSRLDVEARERPLMAAIAHILKRKLTSTEVSCFRSHLRDGGPSDETLGRQQQFAHLLADTLDHDEFPWSPTAVRGLMKEARRKGSAWHPLADRLGRIATCEAVMAPASAVFAHLLGLSGKSIDEMVKRLLEKWGTGLRSVDADGFRELRGEIGQFDAATGDRWVAIAEAAAGARYGPLIELLIEQNRSVMTSRGGAPWVELRGSKFHIRFRDERGEIPDPRDAARMWRFPYFLDALRQVTAQLSEN